MMFCGVCFVIVSVVDVWMVLINVLIVLFVYIGCYVCLLWYCMVGVSI